MNTRKQKITAKSITAFVLALVMALSCAYALPTQTSVQAATTQTLTTKQVKITASSVNVRKGAGTSYSKITSVKKGKIYTYTTTKKVGSVTWYKINYSGTKYGWICGTYASVVKNPTTTITTTTTTSTPTTTTTAKTTTTTAATIATQQEPPYKKLSGAQAYAVPIITNYYYSGCELYSYSFQGKRIVWDDYLYDNAKRPILGTYSSENTDYYAILHTDGTVKYLSVDNCIKTYNGTKKYVNASTLNMRNKASTNGKVVKKLTRNAVVFVQSSSKGWSKIIYNGTTGYVMSKYLSSNAVKSYGFKTKGSVSSSRQKYANKYMGYIPTKIWNRFVDKGWTLRITTEDIRKVYYPEIKSSLAGLTMFDERMIVIGYSEKRIRRALLHEMGHFVDSELGFPSFTDEFEAIYNSEKNKAKFKDQVDKHCTSTSTEYFAEAFLQYLIYPSNLKKNAPKTYAFIKKCISDFK